MSHHRCCRCGGGGDRPCCVCGRCYFPPFSGSVVRSAAATVDLQGIVSGGCCRPVGPEAPCTTVGVFTPVPAQTYDELVVGYSGCEVYGADTFGYRLEPIDCPGGGGIDPFDVTDGIEAWSAVATGPGVCPRFRLPRAGAVVTPNSVDGGWRLLAWSGGELLGPLVMVRVTRYFLLDPGGFPLPDETTEVFVVADADGNAVTIVSVVPGCMAGPCVGGCAPDLNDGCWPVRVDGGAAVEGGFDCPSGQVSFQGSAVFAYTAACGTGGERCEISPGCYGFPCTDTGPVDLSVAFSGAVGFSGLTEACPPAPGGEEDLGSGLGDTGSGDPGGLEYPAEWYSGIPAFRRLIDIIRDHLEPGQTPTPPPGGEPLGGGDPAVAEAARRQAEYFGRGCCG